MAKIGAKVDKKVTFIVAGGLVLLGAAFSVGLYFYMDQPKPTQGSKPVSNRPSPAGGDSLGSLAEAGAAYNQTFQERMLKTVNQSMEQIKNENAATMDAFRREQKSREEERESRLEEIVARAAAAQQAQPDARAAVQVEKITLGSTSGPKRNSGENGGFTGTPDDVKPIPGAVAEAVNAVVDVKKAGALSIPPNGFIKGRTLNGVVAVVGAQPKGFLVKLTGRYQAANGFVVNLDGCTSYVEGRADLSAGRIVGKPATLTCNFADGSSKTWQVSGYIVDQDGIEGLVGVVNDNGGKKLAGAAAASGISLAGSALSRAQTSTFAGAGGATSAFTGSIGQDIAGGLVQGAGSEVGKQVLDHYNNYQASVQVGGGVNVTLVLLNELSVPESGKAITANRSTGTTLEMK